MFAETLFAGFTGAGFFAGGIGYAYGKFRSGKDQALRESNVDLRATIADQNERIGHLRQELSESQNKIANLEGKIQIFMEKNGSYEKLIENAIVMYFEKHPELAAELKSITS